VSIPTFPTLQGLAWPVGRNSKWNTINQKPISGKDTRLALWTYQRYNWTLVFNYLSQSDWTTLESFFNSVNGSALPFHYNDPNDNSVTGGNLGTGDGTTTQFNFVRALGGNVTPVQDVTQSGVVIKVNGTPTGAYGFLTDANWGFTYGIQFSAAPASGAVITANFNYNWPCRFDDDELAFSEILSQIWELKKVSLTSMKVV
jgi:uncharacterized protein (TIGR02217 family)